MVNDEAAAVGAPRSLDSAAVAFDDQRSVADAGLILPGTLAERLGLERLINGWVDLGRRRGAFRPGRKVMSLVHAILAGADSSDDCDLLRSGSTGKVLGHRVMAPSTLGTFLRAFTFGHVRQLSLTRPDGSSEERRLTDPELGDALREEFGLRLSRQETAVLLDSLAA